MKTLYFLNGLLLFNLLIWSSNASVPYHRDLSSISSSKKSTTTSSSSSKTSSSVCPSVSVSTLTKTVSATKTSQIPASTVTKTSQLPASTITQKSQLPASTVTVESCVATSTALYCPTASMTVTQISTIELDQTSTSVSFVTIYVTETMSFLDALTSTSTDIETVRDASPEGL